LQTGGARVLAIVDDFTRECLALVADTSLLYSIGRLRHDFNQNRPHTSLKGLTPNEFAARFNQEHNQNGLLL
jgi:transposase InsO family protein